MMAEINNMLLMHKLSEQLDLLKKQQDQRGQGSGTSPPEGGNMEPRIAKLEASVGHIESDIRDIKSDVRDIKRDAREDFRLLFGAIIMTALGIVGVVAKGFHWL